MRSQTHIFWKSADPLTEQLLQDAANLSGVRKWHAVARDRDHWRQRLKEVKVQYGLYKQKEELKC